MKHVVLVNIIGQINDWIIFVRKLAYQWFLGGSIPLIIVLVFQ